MLKKYISALLVFFIITGFFATFPVTVGAQEAYIVSAGANSLTLAQVMEWLNNEISTAATRGRGECVDFCNYYLTNCWGLSAISGNARDWRYQCPAGWSVINLNNSFDNCQIGDLLVEDYNPGHVCVYYGKENGLHYVVDQNNAGRRYTGKGRLWANFSNPMYCFRPNYNNYLNYGDDFYALILNQPAWKPIGQTDSGNVEIMTESNRNYNRTLWHFIKRNGNNAYRIVNVFNGKSMDVYNAGSSEGANVQCWDANDSQAQYWYLQSRDNAIVLTAGCTSMILDMYNGNSNDGTNIQMWSYNGSNAQKFAVYKVAEGGNADFQYTISADKTKIEAGEYTDITVGNCQYAYQYTFHIIDPNGNETKVNNGCNPVYRFEPAQDGKYTIFAEVKKPYKTSIGSNGYLSVEITVGCEHIYNDYFVEANAEGEQGYVVHTCTKCGYSCTDSYMNYSGGWYTPIDSTADIPAVIAEDSSYIKEYKNKYEKTQKESPGKDWVNAGIVKNEWQNKGNPYETYLPLETSEERVLVKEYYYHWCVAGGAMGTAGNYEYTDTFAHYDEIILPNPYIAIKSTGDDEGHTYYILSWGEGGSEVYCKSGEQCNGSSGYHNYRCRIWYKKYVYQDKEKIELYRWIKESDWSDDYDTSAAIASVRFKPYNNSLSFILGDTDGDDEVSILDATAIQSYLAELSTKTFYESAADADEDGEVTILDATAIQRYLAELTANPNIGKVKII